MRYEYFDWKAMRMIIDAGHGFNRRRQDFGIPHATWKKAIGLAKSRFLGRQKPANDASPIRLGLVGSPALSRTRPLCAAAK
jgi:hypothetical protein